MVAICIDAGTSLVKAVAFDADGTELAIARHPMVVRHPAPAWSEQDMPSVWDAVVAAAAEVARQCAEPVDLISVTGQGDGCWLVDSAGEPTGPAPDSVLQAERKANCRLCTLSLRTAAASSRDGISVRGPVFSSSNPE